MLEGDRVDEFLLVGRVTVALFSGALGGGRCGGLALRPAALIWQSQAPCDSAPPPHAPLTPPQEVRAAFSAAFDVHLRVRRVQHALRPLRLHLARLGRRGAVAGSEPGRACLRRLRLGLERAGLLCAALVNYLHQRSQGAAWRGLAARLATSSRQEVRKLATEGSSELGSVSVSRLHSHDMEGRSVDVLLVVRNLAGLQYKLACSD